MDTIENSAADLLNAEGFELVEYKQVRNGNKLIIRILTDRIAFGREPIDNITLAECSYLNKKICTLAEESEIRDENYTIEVSSPGIDRALIDIKDFARNIGRKARIRLKESKEGKEYLDGIIKKACDGVVLIVSPEHGEKALDIKSILKGKQII